MAVPVIRNKAARMIVRLMKTSHQRRGGTQVGTYLAGSAQEAVRSPLNLVRAPFFIVPRFVRNSNLPHEIVHGQKTDQASIAVQDRYSLEIVFAHSPHDIEHVVIVVTVDHVRLHCRSNGGRTRIALFHDRAEQDIAIGDDPNKTVSILNQHRMKMPRLHSSSRFVQRGIGVDHLLGRIPEVSDPITPRSRAAAVRSIGAEGPASFQFADTPARPLP
jgi:hypothetical protein